MKNFSMMLAIALILSSAAHAQLNGGYTIDASQPTGGTNYATFALAAADLTAMGVSGPVVFNVVANAAPYVGFTIAGAVAGTSATNTVTFLGAPGVFMAGVAAGFTQVIRLGPAAVSTTVFNGPSFIVIDGFDITVPATGAGVIVTGSTSCVVQNCSVHGSNTGAGIAIVNSNNCRVENNEVQGTAATPGSPGSATYAGGISCYYLGSGTIITRNKVHDCTNQGIFVGSSGATTVPSNVIVTNNFIWNCTGTGTYSGGLALRRLGGTSVIANNSVWMTTGAIAGIHQTSISATDPQPTVIANNIVKHDGTGACFRFENASVPAATTFDHNLYHPGATAFVGAVAATTYATLAAWQAAPSVGGKELSTLVGDPGFVSATDLHITTSSPAFNSGTAVAAVTNDIDGQGRPLNATYDRGGDETPGVGLSAGFSRTPTSGAAPLLVTFTDTSFTTAPGGVTSWAWDFQNDGIDDSFVQNPTFTYLCAGSYSVKLTVNDGMFPASTSVQSNVINVSQQPFVMTTTGGGTGDLTITPVPAFCYPTTVEGYTLLSFATTGLVGAGPFAGLYPDPTTIAFIQTPAGPGNPLHFLPAPGAYPDVAFSVPAGTLNALTGLTMDGVEVLIGPGYSILLITNVSRITF